MAQNHFCFESSHQVALKSNTNYILFLRKQSHAFADIYDDSSSFVVTAVNVIDVVVSIAAVKYKTDGNERNVIFN